MSLRVGHGVDAHAFTAGDHVMLGGIRIPHSAGLAAHSDGDVVLHALCDALLGAVADGDIGRHFPSSDPKWQGADSRELLTAVWRRLDPTVWTLMNADITVICQTPRLAPHVGDMCRVIASVLDVPAERVSVKATSTDGLGFTGRGEGIAAMATVLLAESALVGLLASGEPD